MKIFELILLILSGVIIHQFAFTQNTNYPSGGYKSFAELMQKKPSVPDVFSVKKRTKGAKIMNGGAEYRIYCNDESLLPEVTERQLYAVSIGDTLYMNCFVQRAQTMYAKVITEGKYIGFWGPLNNAEVRTKNSGINGGAIGTMVTNEENSKYKALYVVDNSCGIAKPLNRVMLKKILEPYTELQQSYLSEENMEDPEIMLKYLDFINK
jgi:hypothetical protein